MEYEERVGKGEERGRAREGARKGQMVKKSFGQRGTVSLDMETGKMNICYDGIWLFYCFQTGIVLNHL